MSNSKGQSPSKTTTTTLREILDQSTGKCHLSQNEIVPIVWIFNIKFKITKQLKVDAEMKHLEIFLSKIYIKWRNYLVFPELTFSDRK